MPTPKPTGYTMMEMLTVLFIVGLLISLVAGLSRHAQETANRRRALAEIGVLHAALERFYLDHGEYPDMSGRGYNAEQLHTVASLWAGQPFGPYETFGDLLPPDFDYRDPWGHPYRYEYARDVSPDTYDLYSTGSNTNDPNQRIYFTP